MEEAHVPTVMTVGGDPVIMGGKFGTYLWVFKTPQRSSTAVKKVHLYFHKRGIKKVALITSSDGFGRDGKRWLEKLAPKFGIQIAAEESFNPSDTDMTAQLSNIRMKHPEVIICWTIGPAGSIVAKNVKQLGITAPLVQSHGLPDPKYIELAGDAPEGNIMPSTKLMAWEQLPASDPQKKVISHFVHLYAERCYRRDRGLCGD